MNEIYFFKYLINNSHSLFKPVAREKQTEVWGVQQETIRRLENVVREDDAHVSRLRWKLNETERENSRQVEFKVNNLE